MKIFKTLGFTESRSGSLLIPLSQIHHLDITCKLELEVESYMNMVNDS